MCFLPPQLVGGIQGAEDIAFVVIRRDSCPGEGQPIASTMLDESITKDILPGKEVVPVCDGNGGQTWGLDHCWISSVEEAVQQLKQ